MLRRRIVFDIESDGLLEDVTRMWVLVTKDLDTDEIKVFTEGDLGWQDYLYNATLIAGQNIISYDLNVLKKLFNWVPRPETKIHDTLLFSQMMNFRRFGFKGHGLAQWGYAMKDFKGEFNDWSKLSPEMIEYCIQDVNLSVKVYKYLANEFSKAVAKAPLLLPSMRNEHTAAKFMAEAERIGWLFDRVWLS